MDVQRLALRFRIGDMTLQEVSSAAAELICDGVASPSLERLAWGHVSGPDEARWLLTAAADETGASGEVLDEVRSFVRDIASEIVRGTLTPYEGARRIWSAALLLPAEHTYDQFIYAASEYENRPDDRPFFEDAIRREARNFST
ncbi:MAG TPA: hypothetical protein VGF69_08160 [Thermoanaerobaculia bacterium]|jgi:hypothetical protein